VTKFIRLQRIIKEEGIYIILSYLTTPNFIAGICKLFSRRLTTIGGIRTEILPYYKFFIERFVHNYLNDATIFNNFSGKEKFELKGFDPKKTNVIHNTIRITPVDRDINTKDGIIIVSVCRFVSSKDFPTALYSFKLLLEKNRDKKIKYLIIGYGPLESKIRALAKDLNIQNEIEILIKPPNIPEILKKCNIYLSTSLYEGLSNSIMEAMVSGLPIIATNVGDNGYLIKDSYNGFLVPCGEINMIAEKLEYLINSENVRNALGNNGHQIIQNEFSEEKFMEYYLKLFSKMSLPAG
jgi:glycosyltransferase involved in cell wall biosynthesis